MYVYIYICKIQIDFFLPSSTMLAFPELSVSPAGRQAARPLLVRGGTGYEIDSRQVHVVRLTPGAPLSATRSLVLFETT